MQSCIALSAVEAERAALSSATRSLTHLRGLLFEVTDSAKLDLGASLSTISAAFEDTSARRILATADPPRLTPRLKSLAVKHHWFRSHLSKGAIVISAISSEEQEGGSSQNLWLKQNFSPFGAPAVDGD